MFYKSGKVEAEKNYKHLRTLVNVDCQEAFDETKQADQPFGEQMLMNVRSRLKRRSIEEKERLLGFSYEHLLGIAGMLTEECTVWWSHELDLKEAQI